MAYNSTLPTPKIEGALLASLKTKKIEYNITQDKSSNYASLTEAIAAVDDDEYKVKGIVLTFYTGKEWVSMRYNGEDASGFSDEQNWSYETFKADDEDLEQTNGLMKFKDRKYDEANFSGKGYKILRKNIQEVSVPKFDLTISSGCTSDGNITITIGDSPVEVAVTTAAATAESVAALIGAAVLDVIVEGAVVTFKSNPVIDYSTTGVTGEVADNTYTENRNVLTQEMINEANTVYEIRYDFDLNGAEITVPEDCVLSYNGGKIYNGSINIGSSDILGQEKMDNIIVLSPMTKPNIDKIYNNVKEMKSDFTVSKIVQTLGYYESGDGGGGIFMIKNTGKENGGSCHKLSNGLYAHLIFDGFTYNLKQWGITGNREIRKVFDIYPFLTLEDVKKVNPEFDIETTADTYILQYLLDNTPNNRTIILDGQVYYVNHTIHLRSWTTIRGMRGNNMFARVKDLQLPEYTSVTSSYERTGIMLIKEDVDMFDSEGMSSALQLVNLEDFGATGVYGKLGYEGKHSGNFFKSSNHSTTTTRFVNLEISSFDRAIYKNKNGLYWVDMIGLYIDNMRLNGIDLYANNEYQTNMVNIKDCRMYRCGCDVEYTEDSVNFTARILDQPDIEQCNCIVLNGSGVTISYTDMSHGYIGCFIGKHNGSAIIGTYTEGLSYATLYHDYYSLKQYPDSAVIGGYFQQKSKFKYDNLPNTGVWEKCNYGGKLFVNTSRTVYQANEARPTATQLDLAFELLNNDAYDIKVRVKKTNSIEYIQLGIISTSISNNFYDNIIDLSSRCLNVNSSWLINNTVGTESFRSTAYLLKLDYDIVSYSDKILTIPKKYDIFDYAFNNDMLITLTGVDDQLDIESTEDSYNIKVVSKPWALLIRRKAYYTIQRFYKAFKITDSDDTYQYYTIHVNKLLLNFWRDLLWVGIKLNDNINEDIEFVDIRPAVAEVITDRLMLTNDVRLPGSDFEYTGTGPVFVINNLNENNNGVRFIYNNESFVVRENNAYTEDGYMYQYDLPETAEEGTKIYSNKQKKKYIRSNNSWFDIDTKNIGIFSEKPLSSTGIKEGFQYYCTDKQSPESTEPGLMIYYKGDGVWVDALGRVVDDNYPATSPATSGTTEERPLGVDPGFQYFDTTLNKPIWKSADGWVDSTGASV